MTHLKVETACSRRTRSTRMGSTPRMVAGVPVTSFILAQPKLDQNGSTAACKDTWLSCAGENKMLAPRTCRRRAGLSQFAIAAAFAATSLLADARALHECMWRPSAFAIGSVASRPGLMPSEVSLPSFAPSRPKTAQATPLRTETIQMVMQKKPATHSPIPAVVQQVGRAQRSLITAAKAMAQRVQADENQKNPFQQFAAGYQAALDEKPLETKVVTSVVSSIASDVIKQTIEHGGAFGALDPSRTVALAAFGAIVGAPLCHVWFPILDSLFPLEGDDFSRGQQTAKRVATDQLFMTPIFMSLFLAFMSVWENGSAAHVAERIVQDLPKLLPLNWLVWCPVHAVTFSVVPEGFRVLWISVINLFWGTVLSTFTQVQSSTSPMPMDPPVVVPATIVDVGTPLPGESPASAFQPIAGTVDVALR